jgi:Uma2 family endonuclease
VEEYFKMAAIGILEEKGIELIHGEIIEMNPIGSRHAKVVNKLNRLLHKLVGETYIISIQNPVIIGQYSAPEPDVAVLKYRVDFYGDQHPQAEDVLLVIEVSDSTYTYDRDIKGPIYAGAGIPEYWIFHLEQEEVEVFGEPKEDGYTKQEVLSKTEVLETKWLSVGFAVQDIYD